MSELSKANKVWRMVFLILFSVILAVTSISLIVQLLAPQPNSSPLGQIILITLSVYVIKKLKYPKKTV